MDRTAFRSCLALSLSLALTFAAAARADEAPTTQPTADDGPARTAPTDKKTALVRVVSLRDNGMGETFTVRPKRGKKLLFMFPPDGSSKPVKDFKKGERIEVTYAPVHEKRVGDVRLKGKKPARRIGRKRGRKLFRVTGVFKKKTQGDMGGYVEITRNGKDETWLSDFELTGGLDFEKDVGKEVVLTYVKDRVLEFISAKKAD